MNSSRKYICFFAHYNNDECISDYVFYYLRNLHKNGIKIIFISNSKINKTDCVKLQEYVVANDIHVRENKGNDFGAWSWAFKKYLAGSEYDFLLLANDSVYGPLTDLRYILHQMEEGGYDWWGLTASTQGGFHLQSYFLCFKQSVVESAEFKTVFSVNFNEKSKEKIIEDGELALSKNLLKRDFKYGVFANPEGAGSSSETTFAINPTHHLWIELIEEYKFPFIKRELLLKNPDNMPSVASVFSWLKINTDYPAALISSNIIEQGKVFNKEADLGKPKSEIPISAICHIYYPFKAIPFLLELKNLKRHKTAFFFNLSPELAASVEFIEILKNIYPEAVIISTPEKGRDIGGKLALLDLMYRLNRSPEVVFVAHDKLSIHSPDGNNWRDKLLKIVQPYYLDQALSLFAENEKIGMIGAGEFIKSDSQSDDHYIPDNNKRFLDELLQKFKLEKSDYEYVAGCIFLVKGDIFKNFFSRYPPLEIRSSLESGNVSDTFRGTYTHAWERLFGKIVRNANNKIIGI